MLIPAITDAGRRYAARELLRRAGLSPQAATVHIAGTQTTIDLAGPRVRIVIPHDDALDVAEIPVARFLPDVIVPFCRADNSSSSSLFEIVDGCVHCRADVLRSILLTLCRWEETVVAPADKYDRFGSTQSIARNSGFLTRPIVDEYGLALEQAIAMCVPAWQPPKRVLRAKLSHDIDDVGWPPAAYLVREHMERGYVPGIVRDTMALAGLTKRSTLLQRVVDLATISRERGLDSAVYWKAGPASQWDSGYDPGADAIRRVVETITESGAEVGVHPGFRTFGNRQYLGEEIAQLRPVLGNGPLGGRQHFLRWNPATWLDWEACGLAYDSTVGFADHIGFRAGTCIPYRAWLFAEDRESALLEIPLLAMDNTTTAYMNLKHDEAIAAIAELVRRVALVGGVFTLLWHNTSLVDPHLRRLYFPLLDLLKGASRYDWKADLTESV